MCHVRACLLVVGVALWMRPARLAGLAGRVGSWAPVACSALAKKDLLLAAACGCITLYMSIFEYISFRHILPVEQEPFCARFTRARCTWHL